MIVTIRRRRFFFFSLFSVDRLKVSLDAAHSILGTTGFEDLIGPNGGGEACSVGWYPIVTFQDERRFYNGFVGVMETVFI